VPTYQRPTKCIEDKSRMEIIKLQVLESEEPMLCSKWLPSDLYFEVFSIPMSYRLISFVILPSILSISLLSIIFPVSLTGNVFKTFLWLE
jgi:hypothetical protein